MASTPARRLVRHGWEPFRRGWLGTRQTYRCSSVQVCVFQGNPNGRPPRYPPNRSDQSATAATVEIDNVTVARLAHVERKSPRFDSSTYQPRPSMMIVTTRNGHVSTRNAGVAASPDPVAPRSPSKPGTTHHHGNGKSPLSRATNGVSIRRYFNIVCARLHPILPCPGIRHSPIAYCSRAFAALDVGTSHRNLCFPHRYLRASQTNGSPIAQPTERRSTPQRPTNQAASPTAILRSPHPGLRHIHARLGSTQRSSKVDLGAVAALISDRQEGLARHVNGVEARAADRQGAIDYQGSFALVAAANGTAQDIWSRLLSVVISLAFAPFSRLPKNNAPLTNSRIRFDKLPDRLGQRLRIQAHALIGPIRCR